ncbi:MAG: ABC transporter substrate-binding protein [Thermodesulfobacteriota bacterium]
MTGAERNIRRIVVGFVVFLLVAISGPAATAGRAVTDQLGRRVSIPAHPRRIIALAPSIAEIIFALDQGHRLKGVTQYSDYPQAALDLPQVGSYVHLDVEKIVALRPDLCIAVKDGNPLTVIRRLESLAIPVYAVDPRNLAAVMDTITEIGSLLDASDRAEEIVGDMRRRIGIVRETVVGAGGTPTVFFQIGIAPIVSVGTHTFIHELIVMAGGRNLTEGPLPYPRLSREQVIALAPEVLIITSMERGGVFDKVKAEWRRWPDMPAVKNDRILLADSNLLDRASPRLVDGLELLARLIHPELFETGPRGSTP